MSGWIEIIGRATVPATVALLVVVTLARAPQVALSSRYALAAGLAAGFSAGYWLLPDWADRVPARHWQWLPYLAWATTLLGVPAQANGVSPLERWLAHAALALLAAWCLVPTWPGWRETRELQVLLLAGYLLLLHVSLEPLVERMIAERWLELMVAVAVTVALVIAALVSFRYGQVAAITVACLVGCRLTGLVVDLETDMVRGALPTFLVLGAGMAYVGCIEPQPPLYGLLALPLALSALWSVEAGVRWGRPSPGVVAALRWFVLALVLALATFLVVRDLGR